MSRFGKINKAKRKLNHNKNEFNSNFISLAAKKYNKFSEGRDIVEKIGNTMNIYQYFNQEKDALQNKMMAIDQKQANPYFHQKRFETFDRRNRKVL